MLKRTGILLLSLYIIGLIGLALLRIVIGDRWWWVALAYNGLPYYFAPLLILLPLAAALRWRRVLAWMVILAFIGVLWVVPLYIPRFAPAAAGETFSLITFNAFPENGQLGDVETWLLDRDADVILLQETTEAMPEQMPKLFATYPHQSLMGGFVALARYPIINEGMFTLGAGGHQQITLEINNQPIAIYNVHLEMPFGDEPHFRLPLLPDFPLRYDETRRNAQIRQLLAEVRPALLTNTRFIVVGDFNLSEFSPVYSELAAVMGDSYRQTTMGMGATFPGGASEELPDILPPLLRLDYVWHSAGLRPIYSEVGGRLALTIYPYPSFLKWNKPMRSFLAQAIFLVGVLYCVGLAAFLVLRVVVGDIFWWLALLNTFAPCWFVPLLPIVLIALARPSPALACSSLVLLLIGFGWIVLPALLPRYIPKVDGPVLRVVQFNTLGVPQRTLKEEVDWLLTTDADVIVMEEVVASGVDPRLDRLKDRYPYEAYINGATRILTRIPQQSVAYFWLEEPTPGKLTLKVELDYAGQRMSIYAVHLSLPNQPEPHLNLRGFPFNRFPLSFALHYDETRRNAQIDRLLAVVQADPNPVIVAGDFNMSSYSVIHERISRVLHDTYAEAGIGFGHTWPYAPIIGAPAFLPQLLRIDYIWHSDEWVTRYHDVADPLGSDHRPIVADLVLRETSQ